MSLGPDMVSEREQCSHVQHAQELSFAAGEAGSIALRLKRRHYQSLQHTTVQENAASTNQALFSKSIPSKIIVFILFNPKFKK